MQKQRHSRWPWFIPLGYGILLLSAGCQKDYSFEGGNNPYFNRDSVAAAPPVVHEFPICALCDSTSPLTIGSWNFTAGNSFLCGTTTKSGFVGGTTFFTFFGPSRCSIDTGLVVSIYLPVKMDHDMSDLVTNRVALYYYDHNAPKDIFISDLSLPITATISSYILSTGICTGTFNGTVFRSNGDTTHITNGHFKVRL